MDKNGRKKLLKRKYNKLQDFENESCEFQFSIAKTFVCCCTQSRKVLYRKSWGPRMVFWSLGTLWSTQLSWQGKLADHLTKNTWPLKGTSEKLTFESRLETLHRQTLRRITQGESFYPGIRRSNLPLYISNVNDTVLGRELATKLSFHTFTIVPQISFGEIVPQVDSVVRWSFLGGGEIDPSGIFLFKSNIFQRKERKTMVKVSNENFVPSTGTLATLSWKSELSAGVHNSLGSTWCTYRLSLKSVWKINSYNSTIW